MLHVRLLPTPDDVTESEAGFGVCRTQRRLPTRKRTSTAQQGRREKSSYSKYGGGPHEFVEERETRIKNWKRYEKDISRICDGPDTKESPRKITSVIVRDYWGWSNLVKSTKKGRKGSHYPFRCRRSAKEIKFFTVRKDRNKENDPQVNSPNHL